MELKKGTHKVEFLYKPLSFKIGLLISLLTLFTVCSITLLSIICAHKKTNKRLTFVSEKL